ncbi:MAG: Glutamine--scyllo-inositol transaminase, partial [Bacteroidetes bacterium]|nr:Glutamine--scyllo-inositol transaminase [Bacteroidota bacterium]
GVEARHVLRNENARRLTTGLKDIPGLVPQKLYPGTESGSFYLYAMSYKKEQFNGVDRSKFLKAIAAEGVALDGYIKHGLHKEPWVDHIVNSKVYQKMYSPSRLKRYREETRCPNCDLVCQELAMLWASGPLVSPKEEMDDVINAIHKVWENRDKLGSIPG